MATFGELLTYYRTLMGLTQVELARKANLTSRHLEFLLSGDRRPTSVTVSALCDALDLSAHDRIVLMSAMPRTARGHASPPTSAGERVSDPQAGPSVASLLHHYRLLAGLTQEKLARSVGAHHNYIQQIESGQRHPGWRLLRRLAEALRLSDYDRAALFTTAGGQGPPSIPPGQPAPAIYDPATPSLIGMSEIVGREEELTTLYQRLTTGAGVASVALLGIPGVGKTTIATAIAQSPALHDHFVNGVLWGALGERPQITSQYLRWARLLGIPEDDVGRAVTGNGENGENGWKRLLHDAIGTRRLLLILDDAWTFDDAQRLWVGGPNCALLVTTRFPGVAHELAGGNVYLARELDIGQSIRLLRTVAPSIVASAHPESRQLERAFADMVGGLPLALTLTGKYVEALHLNPPARRPDGKRLDGKQTYDEGVNRLQAALQALGSARQRVKLTQTNPITGLATSLRAAIALSEQRLTPEERQAFRSLAVMPPKPATFSHDAARAVSAASAETLERLVAAGLIERHLSHADAADDAPESAARQEGAEVRYSLHKTVRDYARAEGPPLAAERRMARRYMDYAEAHVSDYLSLAREQANLVEAMEAAARRGLRGPLIRMAIACATYFQGRGNNQTIEVYLDRAEEAAQAVGDLRALVKVLNYRALNADRFGRMGQARYFLKRAIAAAEEDGDEGTVAELQVTLAIITDRAGQYRQAEEYLLHAASAARRLGLHALHASALHHLSANAFAKGHADDAVTYARRGLALAREIGDEPQASAQLSMLGNITANLGRYSDALAYLRESLDIAREQSIRIRIGFVSANLGTVCINLGDYAQASQYLDVAMRIGEELKHDIRIASVLVNLAQIACARGGDDDGAAAQLDQAIALLKPLNRPDRLIDLYIHYAELEIERNDIRAARARLREAQDLAQTIQDYPEFRALILLRMSECLMRGDERDDGKRLERAAAHLEEALAIGLQLKHPELIAGARCGLGRLFLKQGQPSRAAGAFRAALTSQLEHRELVATAHFGLAQALVAQRLLSQGAADSGGALDMEALGEALMSLSAFKRMGHRRARAVQAWIRQRFPSTPLDTPLDAPRDSRRQH